jgi:hypothetical protein
MPIDAGFGGHSAPPPAPDAIGGGTYTDPSTNITYVGADDSMNPYYQFGARRLIPNTMALILKDAYEYEIRLPEEFGTFHAMTRPSSSVRRMIGKELIVRGGSIPGSNDVITIWPSFILDLGDGNFAVTIGVRIDLGNDVPGTGALAGGGDLPAFTFQQCRRGPD